VVLAAVGQDGMALLYARRPKGKAAAGFEKELTLAALAQNGFALREALARLRSDCEVLVRSRPVQLRHAAPALAEFAQGRVSVRAHRGSLRLTKSCWLRWPRFLLLRPTEGDACPTPISMAAVQ
jgi:hypothetical protein